MGMLAPIGRGALPVAFKAAGKIMPVAAGGMSRLGGGGWKGIIQQGVAVWAGMEVIDAFMSLFGGDSAEAAKAAAIISAIEDGLDSGEIFIPEPRSGFTEATYMGKLNWFHINMRTGKAWISDKKHPGARY